MIWISIGNNVKCCTNIQTNCIVYNVITFLFNPVMATFPSTTLIPLSSSTSEDTQTSRTDLDEINMEDELNTDISKWSDKERKKWQHMKEFHEKYQKVFGDQASLFTIIRKRIADMNPRIPPSVCEEEMQDASLDTKEVIIEYITIAHGNKVKKLKPLLIKSEPNRTYVQHIPSDDELPVVSEDKFIQKREVTIDSYSQSISSYDEASDDRTVTADSDSSAAQSFEDTPCKLEMNAMEIEATLNQIAAGLQSAAECYLTLASHLPKLTPYELPQMIAQIPPPPIDVPMPIRKAFPLKVKIKLFIIYCVVNMNLLIPHGLDYSKSTMYPIIQCIQPSKEKEDLAVHSINRKEKDHQNKRL